MIARELSDDALRLQLAAFLAYEARGGELCLHEWMKSKDFAPGDRTYLEVTYMAVSAVPLVAS